ncbi:substrate-binding domain-containing protein [Microvirga makkahensis]|uniref:Quinoprotein dehydrogenase-associated putative ABC transporter substrate-binding protein n=1 Tax=Microvirga makkahensis TaxID=1128670 RepID=A0A7X3MS10_9HYPH|nr:substrate-binding domain-containing protein [Microvirga makkahensis]MXQ12076.1 quinoprotein dehydrogenase-associated putative ABC transporter substrate-binding protein [Microvirga makkahensis]
MLAAAGLVVCALGVSALRLAQAQHLPDLVTPNVLRVCADPANMPFTNRKGEGFENKIAAILADELKIPLRYYWMPQGPGFVRNSLGLKLCDVIIGYAAGAEIVQHSNPYYRTVYTALVRAGGELSGFKQLSDQRLRSKRIGVIAATPPVDHLEALGRGQNMKSYSLLVDRRFESPAEEMIADLLADRLDIGILWGPIAGYAASQHEGALIKVPLTSEAERPPLAYRIALGMRPNEIEWKRILNNVLQKRQADIDRVLLSYGVPLLDDDDRLIGEPASQGTKP